MKKPCIALVGGLGSGKTTVAQALVNQHGYTRLALADPLKEMVRAIRGREIDKAQDRELLQNLGQAGRDTAWKTICRARLEGGEVQEHEIKRLLKHIGANDLGASARLWEALYCEVLPLADGFGSPSYWVGLINLRLHQLGNVAAVVDDVRFPNEAAGLSYWGFKVVKLECPDEVRKARILERDGHWNDKWLLDVSETSAAAIQADFNLKSDEQTDMILARLFEHLSVKKAA